MKKDCAKRQFSLLLIKVTMFLLNVSSKAVFVRFHVKYCL